MKFSVIIKFAILILFFIALIAPFTFLKPEKKEKIVEVEEKKPVIVPEKPLHSVKLPDFSSILDIPTKKKSFFGFIKPTVIEENQKIADDRRRVFDLGRENLESSSESPRSSPQGSRLCVRKCRDFCFWCLGCRSPYWKYGI